MPTHTPIDPVPAPERLSSRPSMRDFFRRNLEFFVLALSYITIGGLALFFIQKGDLVLELGLRRAEWSNALFRLVTRMGEEPFWVGALILLLFVRIRYSLLLLATGLSTLAITYGTKNYFLHDRPSAYFKNLGQDIEAIFVPGVEVWGKLSFPSGHSISAFALYGTLAFVIQRKWWGLLCGLLAVGVAFSRVYLVQHFLQDTVAGAAIGLVAAIIMFWLSTKVPEHMWLDRPIIRVRR